MADLRGYPQLQARLRAIGGPQGSEKLMRTLGLSVVREAKLLVPRKTSNLGRSIHIAQVTATSVTVDASAKYAAFVEFGTRAHEITPRAKKALRWAAKGQTRLSGRARSGATDFTFAKRVHHPGTRPHPYLIPGAQRAVQKGGLLDQIVVAWNSAA